jgi:hypothetical protein
LYQEPHVFRAKAWGFPFRRSLTDQRTRQRCDPAPIAMAMERTRSFVRCELKNSVEGFESLARLSGAAFDHSEVESCRELGWVMGEDWAHRIAIYGDGAELVEGRLRRK